MADLSNATPRDWASVLAALPDTTPPADGWARVSRALDAEPARRGARTRHWPLWLAAAGVAALALVPMLPRVADDTSSTPATLARTATVPEARPAPATPVERNIQGPSVAPAQTAAITGDRHPPVLPGVVAADPMSATPEVRRTDTGAVRTARARVDNAPSAARVDPGVDDRVLANPGPETLASTDAAIESPLDSVAQAGADDLVALQAESARLEALVALASDERVGSASGVVLTAGLQDRIGLIDAALSQGDLDDAARVALWQRRISTLRDLAGIESTQRWLAARGERYDGALVRID